MDYIADTEKVRQNLVDAGCDSGIISEFFVSEPKEKMALLYSRRKKLLEDFHNLQKEIDCLDYLIYQTRKTGGEQK